MLCLAFAAVLGGTAGCNRQPTVATDPEIDYDQPATNFTPEQRLLRTDALQAANYEKRTAYYSKLLDAKKIKPEEFAAEKKNDDLYIATLRAPYAGQLNQLYFDGFFHHELKKGGFPIPDKMPKLEKNAAATPPAPPAPGLKK
jgi:hypothetical protein